MAQRRSLEGPQALKPEALAEALELLRATHLPVDDHVVLSRSNRLVIALEPCGLIAKIAPRARLRAMACELAVAAHVGGVGGPVAPPARHYAGGPLVGESVCVTLWERVASLGPADEAGVPAAYLALHEALRSFAAPLPDFREPIREAAEASLPTGRVAQGDAAFVRELVTSHLEAVSRRSWPPLALHGDPHAGNLVSTAGGSLWIDLESVCRGPLEWDLCALPQPARKLPHDEDLLALLGRLRRACVVFWCAAKPEPQPVDLEAIEQHLLSLIAESRPLS